VPRIIAIESDPQRGAALLRLVRRCVDAEVVLADSAHAAIIAMMERRPDAILMSALIAPHEEARLVDYVKHCLDLFDLPVLTVPPVVDEERQRERSRGFASFFRRRRTAPWPFYDAGAVAARICDALEQSRLARRRARNTSPPPALASLEAAPPAECTALAPAGAPGGELQTAREHALGALAARAHRWMSADLPWLSGVKLSWGLDVRLVNISNTGILIESGTKLTPGMEAIFRLSWPDDDLTLPARVVRSGVAAVDATGVCYQTAAAFERTLSVFTPNQTLLAVDAQRSDVIDGLMGRLRRAAAQGASPAALRSAFEDGIRRLVAAREIRIRDFPIAEGREDESVYFTVPAPGSCDAVLQVTFEHGSQPGRDEFEIVKAAAEAAAELLNLEESAQPIDSDSEADPPSREALRHGPDGARRAGSWRMQAV
jgi:hypothetical protein